MAGDCQAHLYVLCSVCAATGCFACAVLNRAAVGGGGGHDYGTDDDDCDGGDDGDGGGVDVCVYGDLYNAYDYSVCDVNYEYDDGFED